MSIHILGRGPITERLSNVLSDAFEVFVYSDFPSKTPFPVLNYSELIPAAFRNQDSIVLGWRELPREGSPKMGILNKLSKNLTKNQKLINLSSVSVYGNTLTPADENHPLAAINPYGQAKIALEQYCDLYMNTNICHLRISNVFGDNAFDDIVNRLLQSQKVHKVHPVVEPVEIERDFISIDSLVNVVYTLLSDVRQKPNHQVFNVSSGYSISLQQLIKMVQSFNNGMPEVSETPILESIIRKSLISNQKIKSLYPVLQTSEVDKLNDYIRNCSSLK